MRHGTAKRKAWVRVLGGLAAASLSGCTLTTGGFHECETDADCSQGRICQQNYCVVNSVPDGCGTVFGRDEANAIPIGAALPFTPNGRLDQSEQQDFNAVLLALEEINQREGVNGRPFVLHFCDTAGDSDKVKAMASWLADEKKAKAIITSGSGQTIAASSVTIGKGVLLMTATSTSPEITSLPDKGNGTVGLVWRTAPSDAIQGTVIADLLLHDAPFQSVKKVGVLYVKDPYGDGLANVLISAFEGQAKTLNALSYARGGDITSAVNEMNGFDPDLTVLVGFPDDAVKILNAAATTTNLSPAAGHKWFFTDSAKDPALISGVTTPMQIEGAYGTAPAQGAGAAYSVFASSFKSKYGIDPGQVGFTSHSYDMMYLLALGSAYALGSDGTGELTGARIAEGLTRVSAMVPPQFRFQLKPSDFIGAKAALQSNHSIDVDGASGTLNFNNDTGEAPGRIELWKVSGSGFTTERMIDPPGS